MFMGHRRFPGLAMLPLLLAAGSAYAQAPGPGRLRAGAAKVDITPKESELKISTDLIRDHLFVRAIVVDDSRSCAVLVGVDQASVPEQVWDDAVSRAASATKCPMGNFIIAGSHTHSGSTGAAPGTGVPLPKTVADSIVSAVTTAKSRLAAARIGYGTTKVDLNVNRDLYNSKQEWRQEPNPEGSSDKTLAVVEFIGEDHVPIAVFLNYAMHPVNFYLSGVISADFPGEASRYVEELFDNRTVAVFSQGALGDQNPGFRSPALGRVRSGQNPSERIGAPPDPPRGASTLGFNPATAASSRAAIAAEKLAAYKQAVKRTGDLVVMMGTLIGASAVQLMRDKIQTTDTARIWSGQQEASCPGRDRLDAANPARENALPGYKDGAPVSVKVGLLRIGDIHFVTANGALYSAIGQRLKAAAPASKTIVLCHASRDYVGYVAPDDAYYHLTFQVIGSRLKPGCAERSFIASAVDLIRKSGE